MERVAPFSPPPDYCWDLIARWYFPYFCFCFFPHCGTWPQASRLMVFNSGYWPYVYRQITRAPVLLQPDLSQSYNYTDSEETTTTKQLVCYLPDSLQNVTDHLNNVFRETPIPTLKTNVNSGAVRTVTIPYIKGTSKTIARLLQPYAQHPWNIRVNCHCQSQSTTVLFRTTFTRTIMLSLLVSLSCNIDKFWCMGIMHVDDPDRSEDITTTKTTSNQQREIKGSCSSYSEENSPMVSFPDPKQY